MRRASPRSTRPGIADDRARLLLQLWQATPAAFDRYTVETLVRAYPRLRRGDVQTLYLNALRGRSQSLQSQDQNNGNHR
jgi:hypothetical protein